MIVTRLKQDGVLADVADDFDPQRASRKEPNDWKFTLRFVKAIFNELEAELQTSKDTIAAQEVRLENLENKLKKRTSGDRRLNQSVCKKSLGLTDMIEPSLENEETRLLDTQSCNLHRLALTQAAEKPDNRNVMLNQCNQWLQTLENAAENLESHTRSYEELKYRSLAFCSSIYERMKQLEKDILDLKGFETAD